ncbi:MAG TPA: TIGR01459 family HAD-type hydrolase [Caulobacteraceae bacterium]|nr:TIGR01459 family HAD-type hydrolase [Caulobacteraceae bacterium]
MMQSIQGLGELAADYDALLCDVWGVVHDGRESFPVAGAALAQWRGRVGPVILISNSPRPSPQVRGQLDALGVPRAAYDALVTSGDATRALLAARAPGPAWAIGPERDAPLYEGLGLGFAGLEEAAFIACTGPVDDERETPQDYRERFVRAARRGLVMICANPDRVVQRGDRLVYCGGALADLYASLGGAVEMAGKPHAPIYDVCLAAVAERLGRPPERARVLAIGDGVATDLAGAAAQGLDALFIGAGIHAQETLTPAGDLDPAAAAAFLAGEGAQARYAMAKLAW